MLLGTHEWLTSEGRLIWRRGIPPDIRVDLPADQLPTRPLEGANSVSEPDAQLARALQELK